MQNTCPRLLPLRQREGGQGTCASISRKAGADLSPVMFMNNKPVEVPMRKGLGCPLITVLLGLRITVV